MKLSMYKKYKFWEMNKSMCSKLESIEECMSFKKLYLKEKELYEENFKNERQLYNKIIENGWELPTRFQDYNSYIESFVWTLDEYDRVLDVIDKRWDELERIEMGIEDETNQEVC